MYWRARANVPPPPGAATDWAYPRVQAVVVMMSSVWGVSFEAIRPAWEQVRWLWALCRRLWWWRDPLKQAQLALWLTRIDTLDTEQTLVLERAASALTSPCWADVRERVRVCATTPKFHHPDHWLAYSRAVKSNAGQAQNIWRHVKIVQELQLMYPTLTNPEAHLLAELGYQGVSALGRPNRQTVSH